MIKPSDLLVPRPEGLWCPPGRFHVDPMRPVARALVTHGHSDHARSGHGAVLATEDTLAIMGVRYGENFCGTRQAAPYGAPITVGDVSVSFHPAGHVLGSAQIAIEWKGLRIVVSGDYKRSRDPTCLPYEVVKGHVFITEATFGLPVFTHPVAAGEAAKLLASTRLFPERTHIVGAYALGKAQRVMALIREAGDDRPIYVHGAMERLTEFYRSRGVPLGDVRRVVASERKSLGGALVICPPSAIQDLWARRFPEPLTAFASGWMRVRARARVKGVELPLIVSDHCDWPELIGSIRDVNPEEVWVTHGQEDALVHWCGRNGFAAKPLHLVGYGDEGEPDEAKPAGEDASGAASSAEGEPEASGADA